MNRCPHCGGDIEQECNGFVVPLKCKCANTRVSEQIPNLDDARYWECGFKKIHRSWTFENCTRDDNSVAVCKRFAITPEERLRDGKGIYLYGECGVGKSYLSICIANELFKNKYAIIITSINEIITELFSIPLSERDGWFHRYENVDFLLIDDFGSEKQNDFMLQAIFRIVDNRILKIKPMIITSNHNGITRDNLKIQRIEDRIHSCCYKLLVTGENYRFKESK